MFLELRTGASSSLIVTTTLTVFLAGVPRSHRPLPVFQ